MGIDAVAALVYRRSDLFGPSGVSGDVVTLVARSLPHARTTLTVDVHRIACGIVSLAAGLNGRDAPAFSAGVDENAAPIRAGMLGAVLAVQGEPSQ